VVGCECLETELDRSVRVRLRREAAKSCLEKSMCAFLLDWVDVAEIRCAGRFIYININAELDAALVQIECHFGGISPGLTHEIAQVAQPGLA